MIGRRARSGGFLLLAAAASALAVFPVLSVAAGPSAPPSACAFSLPDLEGKTAVVPDPAAPSPRLVVFYRGHW